MGRFTALSLLLLLPPVLTAGCTERDGSTLEQLRGCPVAGFDATGLIDCSSRTPYHRDLEPRQPETWKCETRNTLGSGRSLAFYGDEQGHIGFFFEWNRFPEPVVQVGRAVITAGQQTSIVDFGPAMKGFVRFPGTYPLNATIAIRTYGFAANGTPDFLNTRNLAPTQLDHRDGTVYLWTFTAPEGKTYNFTGQVYSPDEPPGLRWGPTGFINKGADSYVHLRLYSGISTTHPFDQRSTGPLDSFRPRPGCEDGPVVAPSRDAEPAVAVTVQGFQATDPR